MLAYLLSKLLTMVYGLLYPAYCSYKAVKTKDVKEYVHWMMYWIVFSIFSFFEVFADTFIGCWFPFYYELKILFMIWMLSPTTRGGSILYRRVIHPSLANHEQEIDAYLAEFKLRTSNLIVKSGAKAFSYVSEFVMTTMLRAGAGEYRLINNVNRACSYENIGPADLNRNNYGQFRELDNSFGSETDNTSVRSVASSSTSSRRNIPAEDESNSTGENVGPYKSKPFSMNDLADQSESQHSSTRRVSTRKKKEVTRTYAGTLPRTKKVSKRQEH